MEICVASPLLFLFPVLLTYIVYKNGKKIDERDPEFIKKFGFLVENVSVYRSTMAKYYVPILLARRMLLVLIPIIFQGNFVFQIQMQIMSSLFYIIYYSGVRPNVDGEQQSIVEYNEVFIMLVNYHLFLFTDFVDTSMQYSLGESMNFTIACIMFRNFSLMAVNTMWRIGKAYLLRKAKKQWEKRAKELIDERVQKRLQKEKKKADKKAKKDSEPPPRVLSKEHT